MKVSSYISLIFILILIASHPANSQTVASVDSLGDTKHNSLDDLLMLETFESAIVKEYQSDVEEFINHLSEKRHKYKNQKDFLRFIFYRVNSRYLRHYKNFATFEDLYHQKSYDCVTGTALYSWIFDQIGVEYQIMETTFHIFLVINMDSGLIIVESTNPVEGFITDPDKIRIALQTYTKDGSLVNGSKSYYYQIEQPVKNQITFQELIGLYYHNMAVEAYNQKNLNAALILQEKALLRYPSTRLKELMGVMLATLSTDKTVDPIRKKQFLSKYQLLIPSLVTASGGR